MSLYALGIGRLGPLPQRPRVRRIQDRLLGIVFVGLGLRLAAERTEAAARPPAAG
ncbi:MAG TPA: hypothetical protein VG276_07255 [Actinomycetes bacterium]|nr:hypothetical protein [Actinomycetes bacterium]